MAEAEPQSSHYAVYYTVVGEDGRSLRTDVAFIESDDPDDARLGAQAAAREGVPPERLIVASWESVRPDEVAALAFVRGIKAREPDGNLELIAGMALISLATALLRVEHGLPGATEVAANDDDVTASDQVPFALDDLSLGGDDDGHGDDGHGDDDDDDDDAFRPSSARATLMGLARGVGALVGFQPSLRGAALAAFSEATRAMAAENRAPNTYPAPPAEA